MQTLVDVDSDANRIKTDSPLGTELIDGQVRLLDGPQTGVVFGIIDAADGWLTLDRPIASSNAPGVAVELREGCDHTLTTCATRFGNVANFRGEPFLPGNDLLTRYGRASG